MGLLPQQHRRPLRTVRDPERGTAPDEGALPGQLPPTCRPRRPSQRVTFVDTDRRAARYFADDALVRADLQGRTLPGAGIDISFLHTDYTTPLPIPPASFDLLISLYAGPVWEHCQQYLSPQGWFLANTSHGDASLAALDPSLRLVAAVHERDGRYRLNTGDLDHYLIPKRASAADPDTIRHQGRGIAYTKTAFAYVFTAVGNQH